MSGGPNIPMLRGIFDVGMELEGVLPKDQVAKGLQQGGA